MHDIKAIRENPEAFDKGLGRRGLPPMAAGLIIIDTAKRDHIQKLQDAQAHRNAVSRGVGEAMKAGDKARAEALVQASDLDWTILKPSLQFGEGDGFFNILAGLVRISPGIVPVPGNGSARFQPIHTGDVAAVTVRALADPTTIRQRFELGGPRYWTYREITREVLTALGKKRAILPMPVILIRLVAGTAELVHIPFPVATDQLRQLRLDNVGPLDLIPSRFGFEPRPMEGALGYLKVRQRDQVPASE